MPAIEADIRFAMVPASIARRPNRAKSLRRLGAKAPIPPIWMPIELKFANPHRANVAMVNERGSRLPRRGPSIEKATSSFSTIRVPNRLPIIGQSCQGMPISHAIGANKVPKIRYMEEGNQPIPKCASPL